MDRIDRYINSIYRGISDSSEETEDLKQEMRDHLVQTVKELQEKGNTEKESIRIAIERFGEEFQIRGELNQVLRLQKLFAKKTLKLSLILFVVASILLITAFLFHMGHEKRYNAMDSQIKLIETKLVNEGITSVDIYIKELFKDEKNNQLTYVAIKELPKDFDSSKNTEIFPGEIKYIYPEKVKDEYYSNRVGHWTETRNNKYLIETGVKTSANLDKSSLYIGLAILAFAVCWILLMVWSIINVYEYGYLNSKWCIFLVLTGIIGYFIFSIYVNPNNDRDNRKYKIIYISALCFVLLVFSVIIYLLNEPYRMKRLYDLIFN